MTNTKMDTGLNLESHHIYFPFNQPYIFVKYASYSTHNIFQCNVSNLI